MAPFTNGSMYTGPTTGGTLNLSDALLADITAASYIFGSTTTGTGTPNTANNTVNTGFDFGDHSVTFISGGNLTLAGTLTKKTGTATVNYLFQANGDIANSSSAGITAFTGTAPAVPHGAINVTLQSDYDGLNGGAVNLSGGTIATDGGNITIGGGTTTPTGSVLSTTNATVTTAATGYALGDAAVTATDGGNTVHPGVVVADTLDATGATTGGNILINGEGPNGTANGNYGVYVNGTTIQTNHGGTININGIGQGNTTSGSDFGLRIFAGAIITAVDGTISLTGSSVVTGTAGAGTYGISLYGFNGTTNVATPVQTTGAGYILVNGTTSTAAIGNNIRGVSIEKLGAVNALGTGNVVINGSGSGVGNIRLCRRQCDHDLRFADAYRHRREQLWHRHCRRQDRNHRRPLTATGTNAATTGSSQYGVYIATGGGYSGTIQSSGNVSVTGIGGGIGSGTDDQGIYVDILNGITTTGAGSISLRGVAGAGSGSAGVKVDVASGVTATGTGNISIYADSLSLNMANNVNSAGSLMVAPYTNNSMYTGPTSGGTLNLSDAQLADLTAASYIFGSTTTGTGTPNTANNTVNTGFDFGDHNVTFISGGQHQPRRDADQTVGHRDGELYLRCLR
ncbi:MAG: hypothetical protein WDN72_08090 [Alphaproteobacteria bacterium]